jgi:hypothetical protein
MFEVKGEKTMAEKTTSLAVVVSPEAQSEAKSLLAARLALLKAAGADTLSAADEDAKRAFLKTVTATFTSATANGAAVDKLVAEYAKYKAQHDKLEERREALNAIDELLKERWNELAETQSSEALGPLLKQHKKALETRQSDEEKTLDSIKGEIEWTDEQLRMLEPAPEPAKPEAKAKAS